MPRDLQITGDNTITLYDPLEKSLVVFTHRTPGTEERVRYLTSRYRRDGDRLIDRSRTALIDAAAEVLTGIRPGDFTHAGAALSSTPGESGYREDWKELVRAAAGDLLYLMGHELFEGRISVEGLQGVNIVGEFDAGPAASDQPPAAEVIPPLAQSSGGCESAAPRNEENNA